MLSLSAIAKAEKNKISSDSAWIVCLKIEITGAPVIRICANNEPITWQYETWTPFPFDIDDMSEDSKGELSTLNVKVSNVTRALVPYIEAGNGGLGSKVSLYIVNSKNLASITPEVEETFVVTKVSYNTQWVAFELGSGYPEQSRRPERRLFKNYCQFEYCGVECGAVPSIKNTYPTCKRTLADCRERGNNTRYGGEYSIPEGGLYV